MSIFTHYDESIITLISNGLVTCSTASELANEVHTDVSGLIKHIKKFRVLKLSNITNKCGIRLTCHITSLCSKCLHKCKVKKECWSCKQNCNQICHLFTTVPSCKRISKFPYVCNGCPKFKSCKLNHYVYDPIEVWKTAKNKRSSSRTNKHASDDEFVRLSKILVPLIKDKHQSLPQIFLTHREEIKWSYPTILHYIDKNLIPGICNLDLTKRVKYPKKYQKESNEPTNAAFLGGRTYDDFISFFTDNFGIDVVEMDTVESERGGKSCLLTLLFRKSNFMLAFKLESKSSSEVSKVFSMFRTTLGTELYAKTFCCILTDNGTEFADPKSIEYDIEGTGEKLVSLFYCDPGKSGQKGKIEKNHVELRKVFPKKTNFDAFNQDQVNLALSHVNSEPRPILNKNTPGEIVKAFQDEKILALNKYSFVIRDEVNLHQDLLK